MATRGDGARRFVKALATMLLVACSLPCPGATDGSSPATVRMRAEALEGGGGGMVDAVPPADPESAGLLLERGAMLLLEGNSKDAVGVLDAAIAVWEEETGSKELETAAAARTAHLLGKALALEGEDERAASNFARAVGASEALFGRESAQAAESLAGLGLALLRQGRSQDAAPPLEGALHARALKAVAPENAAVNLEGQATALQLDLPVMGGEGDVEKALLKVDLVNLLGWKYFVQNLSLEGESMMLKILQQEKEKGSSPAQNLVVSALLFNIGFLRLAVLGRYSSAAEVLQQARALREPVLGEAHALTVQAVVSRGWALTLDGQTLLAVEELTGTAEALLAAGQPHAADRLLRQALQQGYDPLGPPTYAHACYTQHLNLLKGWGSEGASKSTTFSRNQLDIARRARLIGREPAMKLASKMLAEALRAQIEDNAGGELLKLSPADKERLREEIAQLQKAF